MRFHFVLANDRMRQKAAAVILEKDAAGAYRLPPNSRIEVKGPQRSSNQNAAMWAMLGDIAEQVPWHIGGRLERLTVDQWKLVFLDGLRRERREQLVIVPSLDRTAFVDISGKHSSDLSREEMGDLLTMISAFGDQHGVEWTAPKAKGDQRPEPPLSAYEVR